MNDAVAVPADASSVIYLAKAGGLKVVRPSLGMLLLPDSVWHEVVERGDHRGAPEVAAVREAADAGAVQRVRLDGRERRLAARFREALGFNAGECDVLAMGGRAGAVVVDELPATRAALAMGLRVVPALAIPLLAARRGVLDRAAARALLDQVAHLIGTRTRIVAEIAAMIEEVE